MPDARLMVRHPKTPAEIDQFFALIWSVFEPKAPPEQAMSWRDSMINSPGFDPAELRAAFVDGRPVGGCILHEGLLRMGPARLQTGCVGTVATHPDYRHQGVASAVLRDATAQAIAQGYTLLMLDGIPNFYGRFGYIDVHDVTWHAIERQAVLGHPANAHQVRPATLADAPALLALYERHYGCRPGSFERNLEQQMGRLRNTSPDNAPLLAVDPAGSPCGYLAFNWKHHGAHAGEVAADDWPAALALLQHHAHRFDGQAEPPAELFWPLPADSSIFYALADRLPLRSEIRRFPNAGWLARPAHLPELFRSLLPLWQARWAHYASSWSGQLGIRLEGEGDAAWVLRLAPGRVELCAAPAPLQHWISLSPTAFTQLLFGYRPAGWAAQQPGVQIPGECLPILKALFPPEPIWIPGTDSF